MSSNLTPEEYLARMKRRIQRVQGVWISMSGIRRNPSFIGHNTPHDEAGAEVKRSGPRVMPCPFHNEKTSSLIVGDSTYHCAGCGRSGSISELSHER